VYAIYININCIKPIKPLVCVFNANSFYITFWNLNYILHLNYILETLKVLRFYRCYAVYVYVNSIHKKSSKVLYIYIYTF
jgi:hypothetical protein